MGVTVPALSTGQAVKECLRILIALKTRLDTLEHTMTDLGTAVSDLKVAVDGVAARLLPKITALEAANTQLQTALDSATTLDAADKAALQTSLTAAADATAAIKADTATLNTLAVTAPPPPPVV